MRLVEVDEIPTVRLVEAKDAPEGLPESSQAFKRGTEAPGALQGLMSVLQGPTFGFADEIAGSLAALSARVRGKEAGQAYTDTRDYWRGAAKQQDKENPVTSMVTRSMASAPTMLLGPTKQALTMGGQAVKAGLTGLGFGTVSGAGNSDADTALGVAADALQSGALSAGLGAASVPVARGMGGMYDIAAAKVSDTQAARFAKEKVAEAFSRDARGSVVQQNPSAPFQQAVTRFDKLGPEARVIDAGGQNARQLLDTMAILPGQTKQAAESAIRSRQASRADRLINAATDGLQTGGQRGAQVIDNLVQIREQAARPLYGRLHQMEVDANPRLAELVSAAERLGASRVAQEISTANRVPYSLDSAAAGRWSMRDLDHLKQGLDELVTRATDRDGKLTPKGFALDRLRRDLLEELDGVTQGFYKQARDAFAGPSALITATQRGRSFLSADDATTTRVLQGLSESEREAFRIGAFEALRNKLGQPGGQTEVLGMWKNKVLREKLQAVFPSEREFRNFASSVSKEGVMKGLETVGRGSQTAGRQYAAGDLDVPAVADVVQTASGMNSLPGFLSGVSRYWNRVQTPEPVRDRMGALLLGQGTTGRAGLLDLEETMRRVNASRSRNAGILGAVSGQEVGLLSPYLLGQK